MGRMDSAHLQKVETMMHSKLSKMTLSKNLGRDAIAKCSAQLLCEISTRASGAAAAISNFAFSHFFLFSSPCDLSTSTWCPPSPQVAWNGAILSFFALCHLFAHFQAVYLHRNAPPPQTDFEFVHHMENCFSVSEMFAFFMHFYYCFLLMWILESPWQSIKNNRYLFYVI